MITLIFTDGTEVKTRCKTAASAISKALEISPIKGSIADTKMMMNGTVFGVIKDSCTWIAVQS